MKNVEYLPIAAIDFRSAERRKRSIDDAIDLALEESESSMKTISEVEKDGLTNAPTP